MGQDSNMSLKESIIDESKALTPSSDTGAMGEGDCQGQSLRYSTEKEALGGVVLSVRTSLRWRLRQASHNVGSRLPMLTRDQETVPGTGHVVHEPGFNLSIQAALSVLYSN
ncbi:Transcriptional activator protein ExpR, partial [Dissostichus eleginoides]